MKKSMQSKIEAGLLLGTALSSAAFAVPACAQSSPRVAEEVEEIVVTAQRRAENLQDVPISISVLGGEQLDASPGSVIEEVSRIPSVTALEGDYGGRQLNVRGVAAPASFFTGTSAIGYYLDAVPFGFVRQSLSPDSSAYDLERVEVLRGPQGTLYGVSALNGVVRVLTRDPDLDEFELKVRASTSVTDGDEEGYRGDAAINVPLAPGRLAARAVVGYEQTPGWIDGAAGENLNDGTMFNARLKLSAAFTEDFSGVLTAWHSDSDQDGQNISLPNARTTAIIDEPRTVDYDVYALTLDYDFSDFTLSSSTSYVDYFTASTISLVAGLSFPLIGRFDSAVFAQELTLNFNGDGPWRWSVGGIYRDVEDRMEQNVPAIIHIAYNDYSESVALFGEITRAFADGAFEITGGLRYFEDRNSIQQRISPNPSVPLISNAEKFDQLTPRLVLAWHPYDDSTIYASYGEGFRSGFSQSPTVLAIAPDFPGVEPDYLKNYEIGAKGSFMDGLARFETAVFFMDWQGVQQNVLVPLPGGGAVSQISALINGESASGFGFEAALTIEPTDGLEIGASYGWNGLEFDDDVITRVGGVSTVLYPAGDRLANSPEHTATAFLDYSFPLGALEGQFSASANYVSPRLLRLAANPIGLQRTGDDLWSSRVSFDLSSPGRGWTASFFVDNLTNYDGALTPPINAVGSPSYDMAYRPRPRTFGVQLEYRM